MGNFRSGRKKMPEAVRLLRGEKNLERHNHDEPVIPDGPVEKPDTLSPGGSAVWDRVSPVLLQMRTLTPADAETFRAYCEVQASFDEAVRQKSVPGFAMFTLAEDYTGTLRVNVHAAIKLEKELSAALRPFYDYFGMNQFARAKIRVPKPKPPETKWAKLA